MRRVLITGANKGIGLAAVSAVLAKHDDTFVYLGSRDLERGEAARDELLADHDWADRIAVLQLDVSKDASVRDAATHVDELYGIVNNAGIGFGSYDAQTVVNTNTRGPKRVCEAFMPKLQPKGRIVNVASASGPMFVAKCPPEIQRVLTDRNVTWEQIETIMKSAKGDAYGLSKACLNAYTMLLAREHPELIINSCTPGYIATDMTAPMRGSRTPAEAGMKTPAEGTRAILHLLFEDPGGTGWYFGSDAKRSPLDRYRSPGDLPYTGD